MPTTTTSEDPENDKPLAIVRASDIEKSGSQIAILLQISETMEPYLIQNVETGSTAEIVPEAKAEALKTFELVNLRIRDILDDEESGRWGLAPTNAEKASAEVLEVYKQKATAQTKLVNQLLAPHKVHNARIHFYPGTGWVAWVGGPVPFKHDLNGVGNSPAQAFAAFDRAHTEQVPLLKQQIIVTPPAPKARTGSILRRKRRA